MLKTPLRVSLVRGSCVVGYHTVFSDVHGVPQVFVLAHPADDKPIADGLDVDRFVFSEGLSSCQ